MKDAVLELKCRLEQSEGIRRFPVQGLKGAARALFLRELSLVLNRTILTIAPSIHEADSIATELALFMGDSQQTDPINRRVHLIPAWETAPFARVSPSIDVQARHFVSLWALLRSNQPIIAVISVEALMTRTVSRRIFSEGVLSLELGERVDLDALVELLVEAGYQRVPQVEEFGDFSVRGGIVDVFSPAHRLPFRLELDGETIVSLRFFDSLTQRSQSSAERVTVVRSRYVAPPDLKNPRVKESVAARASELGLLRKDFSDITETLEHCLLFPGIEILLPYLYPNDLESIFAYLSENCVLSILEPGRVTAEAEKFRERVAQEALSCEQRHVFFPEPDGIFLRVEELNELIGQFPSIEVNPLITVRMPEENCALPIEVSCRASLKLTDTTDGTRKVPSFEPLVTELREIKERQARALLVVDGQNQINRLRRHLEDYDISVNTDLHSFEEFLTSSDYRPAILPGEIAQGCAFELDGLYIYGEEDLFGEPRVRRRSRSLSKGVLTGLTELTPGTYVVHLDHGIGLYQGLTHMRVAGVEGDFLTIRYADNDILYVPVERINLVQRYIGGDGAEPKLDRLGSGSWDKVKRRTKESLLAMAAELLEVHAARSIEQGHAFTPPSGPEYEEFVSRFEFEETPDQQAAIDDVIRDMTSPKPMDRLICGDAGFGKTEVALRAAFIAAMDGWQVAVLAPTTVLVEQHFNTFTKRFAGFPVRIGMLSRFVSAKETKAVLEDLRKGSLDIVIGTHRLLQNDVQFKRLGLVIIDEEQRFGVRHKEKLKKLRKVVDVLTLAATPIPRTLQMAMLGLRDLSAIQTPPNDRQAVRTFVAHFDDGLIREVILRELNRGGQVFFVHNRVENIDYMARHLMNLVPEAKVAVAHGQMPEKELEKVMSDFVQGRVNLLVCSAIIESGLDIPNANTIIINRADHFGLAQLYQLRGRVGRSRTKGYAYLLIPGEHLITREAKRRIELFCELEELGSGFKVALHDLELRGAGNLLGREQSGNIAAVGFELYMEMLEQTINELRGKPQKIEIEPELQLGIPAYIPETFVADENERLIIYRRLARVESSEELDEIRNELRDRFGPLPALVENLLRTMNLRWRMRNLMVTSAQVRNNMLELRFHPQAQLDGERLAALVNANRNHLRLSPDLKLIAHLSSLGHEQTFDQIEALLDALEQCQSGGQRTLNGHQSYAN